MAYLKKTGKLTLTAMALLLLTACGNATVTKTVEIGRTGTICSIIGKPLDRHMRAVVSNGEAILSAGADEVVVTASELSDTYEGACG